MISAFHLFYQVYLLRVYLTLRLKVRNNSIYSPLKNRLDLLYIIIYDFRHIHVFIMYANLFVLEIELYCLNSIAFYFLKFYLYSSKEEIYLYFIIFFIVYGICSEKYSNSLLSWCKRDCRWILFQQQSFLYWGDNGVYLI